MDLRKYLSCSGMFFKLINVREIMTDRHDTPFMETHCVKTSKHYPTRPTNINCFNFTTSFKPFLSSIYSFIPLFIFSNTLLFSNLLISFLYPHSPKPFFSQLPKYFSVLCLSESWFSALLNALLFFHANLHIYECVGV